MKHFIYILILLLTLSSCSEYQKALKSEDIAAKFTLGDSLYNQGKFAKANKLFAQIVPGYRGKPQAEKLMYLYEVTCPLGSTNKPSICVHPSIPSLRL